MRWPRHSLGEEFLNVNLLLRGLGELPASQPSYAGRFDHRVDRVDRAGLAHQPINKHRIFSQ